MLNFEEVEVITNAVQSMLSVERMYWPDVLYNPLETSMSLSSVQTGPA